MSTDKALEEIGSAVDVCLDEGMTYREVSKAFLREWIQQSMSRSGNNQCVCAAKEGMHRNTLSSVWRRASVCSSGEAVEEKRDDYRCVSLG